MTEPNRPFAKDDGGQYVQTDDDTYYHLKGSSVEKMVTAQVA